MVAQMMKCLLALCMACCLSASAWAQAPSLSAEQVSAAAWSQEQIQARIQELEAERAKSKIVYKTVTRQVDKIIDRPVYRNVCLDADGLRDANAALSGSLTAASGTDKAVRKPDSVGGRDGRGSPAKTN